jgi:predicted nucleotidyltransferase
MKTGEATLSDIKKGLQENRSLLMETFHVREIGVFGSFVRGTANTRSDVDILVDFDNGHKDFFNYMRLKYHLEEVFGRKVDLVMKGAIKPRLKGRILGEVMYVYEAA